MHAVVVCRLHPTNIPNELLFSHKWEKMVSMCDFLLKKMCDFLTDLDCPNGPIENL
jgi:hypothetical protein